MKFDMVSLTIYHNIHYALHLIRVKDCYHHQGNTKQNEPTRYDKELFTDLKKERHYLQYIALNNNKLE